MQFIHKFSVSPCDAICYIRVNPNISTFHSLKNSLKCQIALTAIFQLLQSNLKPNLQLQNILLSREPFLGKE